MTYYLDMDLFQIKHNNIAPKQGKILVSEPFLRDSYFGRSVILLTEHNRDGSVGLILNKPLNITINDVINDFPAFSAKVYAGGPVNTERIFFLHSLGDKIPKSVQVMDNLYWGGDFEVLKELIDQGLVPEDKLSFYIGYSGWGAGQLDSEITQNSWLVASTETENLLYGERDEIWENTLLNLGGKYKLWAGFPQDPSWN